MKTREEYLESLGRLNRTVFILGEKVARPNDHPLVAPSTAAVAETYAMANEDATRDLFTAKSHLTGKTINRFTHIQQCKEDLICKVRMLRAMGHRTATCFQRCAGLDGLNTMSAVTYETDKAHGTNYQERFNAFLTELQRNDEVVAACMTDAKGDRRFRPSDQPDPDVYLRVTERRDDGVVVCGAKCHITGSLNAHHLLTIPTRRLRDDERDWAISFAVPADAPGVTFIQGRQAGDLRRQEPGKRDTGNPKYGGQEAVIIFDNVFVPNERIFMNGETEMTDPGITYFGAYHRASYGGCKSGMGDNIIGAASLMARANGTRKASHIQEKLAEMIQRNEVLWACGLAASHEGFELPSGGWCSNLLLSNVTKLNVTRNPYEIARYATDIAGGLLVTLPAASDFDDPEAGPLLRKYLRGAAEFSTEQRRKILRFIENVVLGPGGVCYLAESVHGAGSPQAQIMQIRAEAPWEELEDRVAGLIDLDES